VKVRVPLEGEAEETADRLTEVEPDMEREVSGVVEPFVMDSEPVTPRLSLVTKVLV